MFHLFREREKRDPAVTPGCVCVSGGTSQFSLMELSQSQDLCGGATNSHRGDVASQPDERPTKSGRKGLN